MNWKFPIIVVTGFLMACTNAGIDDPAKEEVLQNEATVVTQETQQIAALAFISYAGDQLDNTDATVDTILQGCIRDELARQIVLNNRYALAWGPAAYRFDLAFLDDNMMYVVNDTQEPGHIIVSIRGTNPGATLDWLVEDFYVTKTESWPYAEPFDVNARISKATEIGLSVLQGLKGQVNVLPPSQVTLREYLMQRSNNNNLTKITVTGHSLAGALAPVLALWLKDTESNWNQSTPVPINVLPIAGPTPGNAVFAKYYDARLGDVTNRLHNPFDTVPQSWYLPTMQALDTIYVNGESSIKPTELGRRGLHLGIELAKNKDYAQIKQSQAALPGVINPDAKDKHGNLTFDAQAGWQHHCGYYNALNMTRSIYEVNSYCVTPEYCKKNPTDAKCVALHTYRCNSVPIKLATK